MVAGRDDTGALERDRLLPHGLKPAELGGQRYLRLLHLMRGHHEGPAVATPAEELVDVIRRSGVHCVHDAKRLEVL